jgi:hypothetical protein
MAKPSEKEIAEALLERHGCTFAQELGMPVENNTPSSLFRLLCASLLFQHLDPGGDRRSGRKGTRRPGLDGAGKDGRCYLVRAGQDAERGGLRFGYGQRAHLPGKSSVLTESLDTS